MFTAATATRPSSFPMISPQTSQALSGDITNPDIIFYQNDKKNAIAPKITGKAKTAVQEQVNATFVQTISDDIASLISVANANGISAEDLLNDLSKDINDLSAKLSDC